MRTKELFKILIIIVMITALTSIVKIQTVSSQSLFNTLTWDPNSEPDLSIYRIYRSTTSGNYTLGQPIGTVPKGSTNYVDNNIQPDVTYYYVVTAVNASGMESAFSNEVSIMKSSESGLPQLSNGSVAPASGNTTTDFTYTVHFYDSDGQTPSLAKVYIDDQPNSMTLSSGSVNDGDYTFTKKLGAGDHTYYFYFTDSSMNEVRLPESGTLSGPTVTTPEKPEKPRNVKYKNK